MDSLRYPIGQFHAPKEITTQITNRWIETLANFPERLKALVTGLSDQQLNTPYREGGWTIRQVIHHCADSHHHSYNRFKWAMTENNPTIKAYDEANWADLHDYTSTPIELSFLHLQAVHAKLVLFLKGLTEEDLNRTFFHPESEQTVVLKNNIGIYAWHCNHHYEHIHQLMLRKGWK